MTNIAPIPRAPPTDEADERIMKESARLFREKGFAATTVREIAAAAKMLPGSLHYRYASKDEILISLMERGVRRAIAAVHEAVDGVDDPIKCIRLGLEAHLQLLIDGEEDALYVLLFDWRSLPPGAKYGLERVRGRYEQFWDGILAQAWATGKARQALDLTLVRQFGFGALNWVATWFKKEDGRSAKQIADTYWTYMAFGLLGDHGRPPDVEQQFTRLMENPA